jgi:NAD(P)-dependent dehydrogenase (short-subunit alcohol dehydrogenase family)
MNEIKTVVVTGASSGIGCAVASELMNDGYNVVVTARDESKLRSLYDGNDKAIVLPWDLSEVDRIGEYAKQIRASVGEIYGLVHSAGAQDVMPLHLTKPDLLDKVFHLNTYAAILLVSEFSKKGMHGESASFVLLSSLSAHEGTPGRSVYAASKAALEGFAIAASPELNSRGVRVNCVAPGIVNTPAVEHFMRALSKEQKEKLLGEYPLGVGAPEDIARLIGFLISGKSKWITGNVFKPDGGHLAR